MLLNKCCKNKKKIEFEWLLIQVMLCLIMPRVKFISSTKEFGCRNEKMVIEVDRREKNVSFTNSQNIASLNHERAVKLN